MRNREFALVAIVHPSALLTNGVRSASLVHRSSGGTGEPGHRNASTESAYDEVC